MKVKLMGIERPAALSYQMYKMYNALLYQASAIAYESKLNMNAPLGVEIHQNKVEVENLKK